MEKGSYTSGTLLTGRRQYQWGIAELGGYVCREEREELGGYVCRGEREECMPVKDGDRKGEQCKRVLWMYKEVGNIPMEKGLLPGGIVSKMKERW